MTLYEFYGDGCKHCKEMEPKVEKLEKEEGVEVEQLEVWENEDNREKYAEKDGKKNCGGVPYFYNDESGEYICGAAEYDALKSWAEGEEIS